MTEHKTVMRGELDIIMVTNETSPFFIAAKYARSPTRVAKIASMPIKSQEVTLIFFNCERVPLQITQLETIAAANIVLMARPERGEVLLNPTLANIGAIPQQTITKSASKNTVTLFPPVVFFIIINILT